MLPIAILALLRPGIPGRMRIILAPLLGFGLAMFYATQYWRYLFPVIPLAAVTIGSLFIQRGAIWRNTVDMVCEKNEDSLHDFDNDPIKLIIKDDYIYADNTTLRADNGIAVAYMMALLTAKDVQHPAIEALFTVDEETTMLGAFETAEQNLRAKYMINLDMECDDELPAVWSHRYGHAVCAI